MAIRVITLPTIMIFAMTITIMIAMMIRMMILMMTIMIMMMSGCGHSDHMITTGTVVAIHRIRQHRISNSPPEHCRPDTKTNFEFAPYTLSRRALVFLANSRFCAWLSFL